MQEPKLLGTWAKWLAEMVDRIRHINGNTLLRLGDSGGSTKISVRDSADVEVASVNSDGAAAVTKVTSSGQIISTIASGGSTAGVLVSSASPALALYESDQGTDERTWDILAEGKVLAVRTVNDANNSTVTAIQVTRGTGTAVTTTAIPGGVGLPRSSGAAVFAVDASGTGSAITLADTATAQPFGGGTSTNFSGLIIVNETAVNGQAAVFLCAGTKMILISETTAGYYSVTQGTASRMNVYLDGNYVVVIENRQGGSRTINVSGWRTRTTN